MDSHPPPSKSSPIDQEDCLTASVTTRSNTQHTTQTPVQKIESHEPTQSMPVTFLELQALSKICDILKNITIYDLGLEGHDIRNCTLVRMNLKNCNLINCSLEGCSVTSSADEGNDYGGSVSSDGPMTCFLERIERTTIWRSTIVSCTIQNAEIYHSQIERSLLTNAKFEVGQMRDSRVNESILSNIFVENTSVAHCCLDNSTVTNNSGVNKSRATTSPLALNRFPPDIRLIIFEAVLVATCTRETATGNAIMDDDNVLITALRGGDMVLYGEALDVMYKTCSFSLNCSAFQRAIYMPRSCRHRVRFLWIE